MNGQWIILLWALLGFVFLLKATPFRRLVSRVRRQPPAVQAAAALCLLVAVIVGGTKPGGTNAPSSSPRPAAATSNKNSSPLTPHTSPRSPNSSLPSWWADDPTDTDGDGIPDLWEKWTHGNRYVADSDIDRDGDGLTDLEEFQHQTDPRTADTDGDGFDDAFEVAHGMDPIAQEDFTPVEPDENGNGVIDIWEGTSYLYGFTDADNNGFDDCYEAYHLEPASAGNYDVRVDVFTSRSAVLTWTATNETHGIVLPATAGTSVRLRLPFGEDAQIRLLPAPEGEDPPAGELWKARLRQTFAPRDGQTAIGTCIVSDDGDIQQRVVVVESTISRFSDAAGTLAQGPAQTQSLGGGTAGGAPHIEVTYRKLGVKPVDPGWHFVGELIGPFSITNYAGALPDSVTWSADCGSVSDAPGSLVAYLRVTEAPPPCKHGVITLKAVSELDAETFVTNRIDVPKCIQPEFSLTDGTGNFSPHLGEVASFTLTLPGCNHAPREGWLEGELMRETTAGWQHVGWLDASQAQPGHQRRRRCLFGPQTITWDGVATESAAPADSPAVFTLGRQPFNRALPAVVSGEPVPPPYCTIFFRYRKEDGDTAEVIAEASTTVHVPQIVKIEMTDEAYNEFVSPIVYPDTYWPQHIGETFVNDGVSTNLYDGCPGMSKTEVLQAIAADARTLIPSDVNIQFAVGSVSGRCKHVRVCLPSDYGIKFTNTSGFTEHKYCSWRNENPFGICYVFANNIKQAPCEKKLMTETGARTFANYDPAIFPFNAANLVYAVSHTAVHEVGHAMGLVNPTYLYGTKCHHNSTTNLNGWIMNQGICSPDTYSFRSGSFSFPTWQYHNAKYLNFILPRPTP
ncbi:MAG: hypothetical protein ACOX9C_10200 [Kiritimatiellia bacterium]